MTAESSGEERYFVNTTVLRRKFETTVLPDGEKLKIKFSSFIII